jgi:hypothetical protein
VTTRLLDYFAQKVPVVAAEQERLHAAISTHLGLPRGGKGAGRRPNPFLFLGSDRSVMRPAHRVVARHFVVPRRIPLEFRPFFGQAKGLRSASSDGLARLKAALGMARAAGALAWIRQVVRVVVLFRGGALNSFYNPRAHGAVFIRLNRHGDDLHVLEELVHQAGHAFFAILLCREPPLIRNQRSSLTEVFDKADDERNVLVAFHGLVTEAVISDTLFRLAASRGPVESTVLGRLAFCLAKFGSDLNAAMRGKRLLTKRGVLWLSAMARSYESTVRALGPELLRVDLTDQPYVFDPQLFRRKSSWLERRHYAKDPEFSAAAS